MVYIYIYVSINLFGRRNGESTLLQCGGSTDNSSSLNFWIKGYGKLASKKAGQRRPVSDTVWVGFRGGDAILCNYQTATFPCPLFVGSLWWKNGGLSFIFPSTENTQNSDNPHQSSYYCPMLVAPSFFLSFFLFMTEEFELTSIFSDGGEGMFGLIYVCLDYASFWSGQRQIELGDSHKNFLLGYDSKRWSSFELGCVHLQFIILCS